MRILFSAALVAATATAALAADLPSRRAPPVYAPPPIPVFTWSGAYIGGNAGYAFDSGTSYQSNGNAAAAAGQINRGVVPAYARTRSSGFTGGGQVGYNFELGNGAFGALPVLGSFGGVGLGGGGLVAGVEADAAYTDLRDTNIYGGGASTLHSRTDFVGTVRGRLGIAIANALVYGTGGFAYGGVHDTAFLPLGAGTLDKIQTGYAYGGGVEYAIPTTSFVNIFNAGAVTLKAEYLHYDLGSNTIGYGPYTTRIHNDGNIVRGGINYKFNTFAAPAPVVARY